MNSRKKARFDAYDTHHLRWGFLDALSRADSQVIGALVKKVKPVWGQTGLENKDWLALKDAWVRIKSGAQHQMPDSWWQLRLALETWAQGLSEKYNLVIDWFLEAAFFTLAEGMEDRFHIQEWQQPVLRHPEAFAPRPWNAFSETDGDYKKEVLEEFGAHIDQYLMKWQALLKKEDGKPSKGYAIARKRMGIPHFDWLAKTVLGAKPQDILKGEKGDESTVQKANRELARELGIEKKGLHANQKKSRK